MSQPLLGKLKLELIEGKFCKDVEAFGKMDPYVNIKLREYKWSSKVCEGQGKAPKWNKYPNQHAILEIKYEGDEIIIDCRDDDMIGHKAIGSTKVKVSTFTQEKGFDDWIEIFIKGKTNGKLHFKADWNPVNPPIIQEEVKEEQENLMEKMDEMAERMEEKKAEKEAEEETARLEEEEAARLAQEALLAEQEEAKVEPEYPSSEDEVDEDPEEEEELPIVELTGDHTQHAVALRKVCEVMGRPITLKSFHGTYLENVEDDSAVVCTAEEAGENHVFIMFPMDNGKVVLRHMATSKTLQMNLTDEEEAYGERRKMRLDNENMDVWEWLDIEYNDDEDCFHFSNAEHGGYTMNCNPGGEIVHGRSHNRGPHERWFIEKASTEMEQYYAELQFHDEGLLKMKFNL